MKHLKLLKFSLLLLLTLSITSCFEDRDDNAVTASVINDFVWKGMNAVYLYKEDIPDLANNRFSSNGEYADYLNSFTEPEDLFESLIYERETVDRFSAIIPNYIEFEQLLAPGSRHISLKQGYLNVYIRIGEIPA